MCNKFFSHLVRSLNGKDPNIFVVFNGSFRVRLFFDLGCLSDLRIRFEETFWLFYDKYKLICLSVMSFYLPACEG